MASVPSRELLAGTAYLQSAVRDTAREWSAMFTRGNIANNLAAGLTVTLVALPLNVALAIAAGLPPAAGLATAAVAGAVGALFGGSRFQITGPEVALAPITVEIAGRHGLSGLAVATFLAGCFQLVFGVLRVGSLVHAMPLPVVGGFLAAVGLLVFDAQLPHLLGLPERVHSLTQLDLDSLARGSLPAFAIGLSVVAIMVGLPRINRRLPAPLIALLFAVASSAALGLGLPTVGPVHASLPTPTLPLFGAVDLFALVPEALALALLASIDSLLCAVSMDALVGGERTRIDQELAAQGVANLASACVGGMPVAAAVVRSVAAHEAGANTRLAALTQALCMTLLVFVAPLLVHVPLVALAAVLLVVGARLVQWRSLRSMWRMARSEALIFVVTALCIIATDFVLGVALGVIAALARFAQQQRSKLCAGASPDLPETDAGMRVLRLEGPLFFGSQRSIEDALSTGDDARLVVIDLSAVSTVDMSGATALGRALDKLAARSVCVKVTTFGATMDPLLRWVIDQRPGQAVSTLEPRDESALSLAVQRAHAAHALNA
jgi:SulP family sulfate permease